MICVPNDRSRGCGHCIACNHRPRCVDRKYHIRLNAGTRIADTFTTTKSPRIAAPTAVSAPLPTQILGLVDKLKMKAAQLRDQHAAINEQARPIIAEKKDRGRSCCPRSASARERAAVSFPSQRRHPHCRHLHHLRLACIECLHLFVLASL